MHKKLAKHLDNLPGGYPSTESGVELRLLKRLFSEEEAGLALHLTMIRETPEAIAKKAGIDEAKAADMLEDMSKKGLVFRAEKAGKKKYMAAQFVIGIWEYQVNRLNTGIIEDLNEYSPHLLESQKSTRTKQLRVVPISKTVTAETRIMPYEDAESIIRSQSKIVIADCICRKEHKMIGKGCDGEMRACFIFGSGAYFYEGNGLGKSVSVDEAIEILHKGIEAGLVLQPGNSKKPTNICMCCGCCCQILKNVAKMEKPAEFVCSSYYAVVDADTCVACGNCEDKCPMDAISVEDTATVYLDKCIGCGVCAGVCDVEAIRLAEKEESEKWVPPKNTVETYMRIAQERGLI